jgi:hypothetical protein
MCNISAGIMEDGIIEGRIQGRIQGRIEGILESIGSLMDYNED